MRSRIPRDLQESSHILLEFYIKITKNIIKPSLHFSIFSSITLLLSFQVPQIEAALANSQSFEQWCLQKDSLPVDTKKTVEVMLKVSGTQDCKLADVTLNRLSIIELSDNQISDVKPLASLTNLSVLTIYRNQIIDILPLKSLTKLTELYLSNNKINEL